MNRHYDVAVVGGGIVGLAHAWMASRRGHCVILLERTSVAQGASVRNFGMVWPIGQPAGELYSVALRSRDFWCELGAVGVVTIEECGSVHLAHRPDELAVLEEFCGQKTHQARMLDAKETLAITPLANGSGLLGGMHSETELRVDPRTASARIAGWLAETERVECFFRTSVTKIEGLKIHSADGRVCSADRIIVCSGSDLETLFPDVLLASGLRLCKLQMLKSVPQPVEYRGSVHVASGLTLRHYTSFHGCPSLEGLKRRVAEEAPELDRFGVHVMATQFPTGEVIIGDSHEYGDDIAPFDKSEIDDLILRELRKVIRLDDWTIRERWHGIYAKHPSLPVFEAEAAEGVHVFTGTGGAGMTMSFGLAARAWDRWEGEER